VNYRPTLWPSPRQAKALVKEMIPQVHLLKVNEDELDLLVGDDLDTGARSLLELGPELVIVTLGPDGCYFRVAEGGTHVPGFKVETVDATGCGDAFIAALLTRLVVNGAWRSQLGMKRLRDCMRYANAVGALTAMTPGVIPALPTSAKVDAFLREHGE
jgi:fructokinase